MTLLILGLMLWFSAHLFRRVAPDGRQALSDRMGDASKGVIAITLIVSVVLMVFGYKAFDSPFWWGRNAALVGINNILMLLAVYLFAASGTQTWITSKIRHPQLTGFKLWCVAHLLVNGDLASFILFGGLLIWAVVEVIVLNRVTEDPRQPKEDWPLKNEARAIDGTIVVFAVISGVHSWLGYNPFGA